MMFNYKDQKVINEFKEYVEKVYLDFINEEIIDEYISGKITIKEFTLRSRVLIERVLSNIQKVEVFGSGELPF